MISAFTNSLKIPELRQRIVFTLLMLVIIRLGATITLPGVDVSVLQAWMKEGAEKATQNEGAAALVGLMNIFSGGGLQNCAVFALGIMPYISASIMMQLMTAVLPGLGKLSREDGGRQKINMYTRYVAIVLCVFQGYMLAKSLINPQANPILSSIIDKNDVRELVPDGGAGFILVTVIVITAGTLLLMWMGDQITDRGIGNGISLIITANIISALPAALGQVYVTFVEGAAEDPMKPLMLVALFAFLFFVIAAVISITQAQRRLSVHYAKRVVGRKVYGGQTQYMPLKVNYAGVMPIIFAQAILLFPSMILKFFFPDSPRIIAFAESFGGGGWPYYLLSALMIFFFSYFWVATMFQPNQIAEDLKKNGGYLPGVRPGKPTAEFLDRTMSRLTFAGAIFLTIIAVLPSMLSRQMGVPFQAAQFFGGTSLLILVGVLLDIMRQVETHLIQRHYDGFLRKGKIRGRFDRNAGVAGVSSSTGMVWLGLVVAILIIVGVTYSIIAKG